MVQGPRRKYPLSFAACRLVDVAGNRICHRARNQRLVILRTAPFAGRRTYGIVDTIDAAANVHRSFAYPA